MTTEEEQAALEGARESLTRLQKFDVSQLPRKAQLGEAFHFEEAIEPAQRLVDLFSRLSVDALTDLGRQQLDQVTQHASTCLSKSYNST